jgi:hypothetical protein
MLCCKSHRAHKNELQSWSCVLNWKDIHWWTSGSVIQIITGIHQKPIIDSCHLLWELFQDLTFPTPKQGTFTNNHATFKLQNLFNISIKLLKILLGTLLNEHKKSALYNQYMPAWSVMCPYILHFSCVQLSGSVSSSSPTFGIQIFKGDQCFSSVNI